MGFVKTTVSRTVRLRQCCSDFRLYFNLRVSPAFRSFAAQSREIVGTNSPPFQCRFVPQEDQELLNTPT